MIEKIKWLKQIEQLSGATEEELKNSLTTCDGCGKLFKEKVIEELLSRVNNERQNNE
tara:strand:- start:1241 stop:1411 length:171 start_codon:yes stop_codon:yes gene_type:complete